MRFFIIIFFFLISCVDNKSSKLKDTVKSNHESPKTYFNQYWVFEHEQFANDTVTLLPLDSSQSFAELIKFNDDGSLVMKRYMGKKPRGLCGNGLFYIDSTSTWTNTKIKNEIILTLNGGYFLESQFKIKSSYNLDTSNLKRPVLIRNKLISSKGDIKPYPAKFSAEQH